MGGGSDGNWCGAIGIAQRQIPSRVAADGELPCCFPSEFRVRSRVVVVGPPMAEFDAGLGLGPIEGGNGRRPRGRLCSMAPWAPMYATYHRREDAAACKLDALGAREGYTLPAIREAHAASVALIEAGHRPRFRGDLNKDAVECAKLFIAYLEDQGVMTRLPTKSAESHPVSFAVGAAHLPFLAP